MPPIHKPTIDEMELAFHWSAESHERVSETLVPTRTKYTDNQMLHLMVFCGLKLSEEDQLPKIWTNIQTTKDWFSASTELNTWFWVYDTDGDKDFQFHKKLVDDLRKLIFSLGHTPLVDNAHRGISILAFGTMSVQKEN